MFDITVYIYIEITITFYQGADPGILVRGGVDFFSKAWGLGAAFRPLVGPGWKLLIFSDFRSLTM